MTWEKYLTRRLTPFKVDLHIKGLVKSMKKNFNFELNSILFYGEGEKGTYYLKKDEINKFHYVFYKYVMDCIDNYEDPLSIIKIKEDKLVQASKIFGDGKNNLHERYDGFIEAFYDYQILMWFPLVIDNYIYPRLKEITNLSEYEWKIISEPCNPSFVEQERIDLIHTTINPNENRLEKHTEKYSHSSMWSFNDNPYNIEHYKNRIKEIKDPFFEIINFHTILNQKRINFIDILMKLNGRNKAYAQFINKANEFRQVRDMKRRLAHLQIKPLFNEIVEKHSENFDNLLYHFESDVRDAIKNNKKLIKRDLEKYMILYKNKKYEIITENINEKLIEEGLIKEEIDLNQEIKGKSAYKGIVKGIVKKINLETWKEDVNNLKKNEILVAISTKPDYIPAMERASAFVTDEGGITAHAAIVSREMKKPCIVGTKNATSILKDGDLIKVDADKGIIRRLLK